MIRTGNSSEVSRTSTLRRAMRSERPDMVTASASAASGRGRRDSRGTAVGDAVSSDTGGLLVVLVLVVVGRGSVGGVAGQGQKDVVEGGAVDGEAGHGPPGRVDLVQQGPHLGGAAVGGHPDGQALEVALDAPAVQLAGDLVEGGGVGQHQVEA